MGMKCLIYVINVLVFVIAFAACSNSLAEKESNVEATSSNSKIDENNEGTPFPTTNPDFPDFRNFTFPKYCLEGDTESFILKDGVYRNEKEDDHLIFAAAKYADVTGDGNSEALVVLDIITGGSMMPQCVYIFTLENPKTKAVRLLWDFQTGDRADGGLRKIYGENENLVVERFSPEEKSGDCCPKYYIKETYKWNKNVFEKQTQEKFLNPQ